MVAGSVAGSVSRQWTCESDGICGCISKETGPVAELAATCDIGGELLSRGMNFWLPGRRKSRFGLPVVRGRN